MTEVICLGEAMGEIAFAADGSHAIGVGGDTFNTAIYMARSGTDAAFVSAVGDDPFGAQIRAALAENGVEDRLVVRDGESTGLYSITNDASGERFFHYWRSDAAARRLFLNPPALDAKWVYVSGISLYTFSDNLDALFEALQNSGAKIAFDGNYRPRLWKGREDVAREAFARIMSMSSLVLPTFDDEVLMWGDASPEATLARIADLGVETVVLKQGPEGCLIHSGGETRHVPVPGAVTPVDTTAAGDSFNAAFLASYLGGGTAEEAALAGHHLAAKVIAHRGAIIPK
ncbi:sugar kinase [Falsirhodobacter sp. alg1]|uniref:sugar kinase n=1 Tax=Falsirhodobacter sp. alg1 TaxID=1472418 RepID=UPI0005ED73B8|nr:sugar kinase [Falsirhodobacter sp. alg1]